MKKHITVEIVSFLLILLFVYTASSKLMDYWTFHYQVGMYPWIKRFGRQLAWMVPTTELLVALLIFIPKTKLIGLYASLGLLILFTTYLLLMLKFGGKDLPCSCGGVIRRMTWKQHIFFNTGFIAINILGILSKKGDREPTGFTPVLNS